MKVVRSNHTLRQVKSLQCLPFLYCTPTILREPRRFRRAPGQATLSTTSHLRRVKNGVPENTMGMLKLDTEEERVNYFQQRLKRQGKGREERAARPKKNLPSTRFPKKGDASTITGKEQQVFRAIFEEISGGYEFKKRKGVETPEVKTEPTVDYREIFAIFSSAPFQDGSVKDEKETTAKKSGVRPGPAASEERQASPTLSEQDQAHIQKYPERLRKIASRATLLAKVEPQYASSADGQRSPLVLRGHRQLDDTEASQDDLIAAESEFSEASATEKSQIDSICTAQMKTVSEFLIMAAETSDSKLWRSCEKYVLPLLMFLEEDPSRSATTTATNSSPPADVKSSLQEEEQRLSRTSNHSWTTNPDSKHHKRVLEMKEQNQPRPDPSPAANPRNTPFHIPATIPPLPIISTLYPALLLLTLRLLTTHFPLSPYPATLLPTLRTLGLRSYVLGTSTQLYNTLLSHRWAVYSDLKSMDSLLNEMERGGVDFDAETVQILERVRADKVADALAESGAREERERERMALSQLNGEAKKKMVKETRRKGPLGGQPDGTSEGKRARLWWEAEATARWLERVTGVWRARVMERVRERSLGDEAVVEREYAASVGGGGDEHDGRVLL